MKVPTDSAGNSGTAGNKAVREQQAVLRPGTAENDAASDDKTGRALCGFTDAGCPASVIPSFAAGGLIIGAVIGSPDSVCRFEKKKSTVSCNIFQDSTVYKTE